MTLSPRSRRAILPVVLGGLIAVPIATSVVWDRPALLTLEGAGNVLGLLETRSPGERTAAELTKAKRDRTVAEALLEGEAPVDGDVERALGKEFPAEDVASFETPEQLLALAATPEVIQFATGDTPPESGGSGGGFFIPPTVIGTGGGGTGGPGGGGPGGSGPGGGGPGGDGPGDSTTPPSVVPPAVPEPDTWTMMVLGMGLCGYALRRRNRVRLGGAPRPCEVS